MPKQTDERRVCRSAPHSACFRIRPAPRPLTLTTAYKLDERPNVLPPDVLSPPVLHVRLLEDLRDGCKDDLRPLDRNDCRRGRIKLGFDLVDVRERRLALECRAGGRPVMAGQGSRGSGARVSMARGKAGAVVRLEELHASRRKTDGPSSVKRRRNASLEGVAERGRASVKELGALLGKDVGENLGGVDRGRLLVAAGMRSRK